MAVNKKQIVYFNVLKAIACVAVVVLHSFFGADGAFTGTETQHLISLSVKNCMTWAVPAFVMVSGALLLSPKKKTDYKKILSVYLVRMLLAILVFTAVFELVDVFISGRGSVGGYFLSLVKKIFTNGSWSHMWYLYMMAAVYLTLPVFKKITEAADKRDMLYLLAVSGGFLLLVPTVKTLTNYDFPFYIFLWTCYPFYLFLGHALHSGIIKINRRISLALFIFCLALTAVLTVIADKKDLTGLSSLLSNYSSLLIAVCSGALFSFMSQLTYDTEGIFYKIAGAVSSATFGVYLIHMIFLKLIYIAVGFDPFAHGGVLAVVGIALVVFALSVFLTLLLKKVPYVKNII
jgi:surface polysaccharide O-acyltransferase-like enzyme